MPSNVRLIRTQLLKFALGLPEAHEDLPWGERVVKVKKKVFVFLGRDMDAHFGLGVKLPSSKVSALALPFTAPTGYGLGKSGWVSAKFEPNAQPSFAQLRDWVKESYCAVAPKSLAALLASTPSRQKPVPEPARATPAKRRAKPVAKRAAKSTPKPKARRAAKP